mmetsp:Transcript_754/g.1636  ORF Transcript_754/g.1636 Transcript_754/m.1636 type:complete len:810 (-) Transcript_754:113-2542(-)
MRHALERRGSCKKTLGGRLLRLWVDGCTDLPVRGWVSRRRKFTVRVTEQLQGRPESGDESPCVDCIDYDFTDGLQDRAGRVTFKQSRYIEVTLEPGTILRFEVFDNSGVVSSTVVGFAEIGVTDLARERRWKLLLEDTESFEAVYGTAKPILGPSGFLSTDATPPLVRRPAFVHVRTQIADCDSGPRPWTELGDRHAGCGIRREKGGRTRVLIITRGTRGDVQPFVALARGLILHHRCEVTIVTELAWKAFIKESRSGLPEGTLRFRPSGGDTVANMSGPAAQFALREGQRNDALQSVILSNAEASYFPSEGMFYWWAYEENPDFIVFTHVLPHLAMIISEALQIPIVGFLLQPVQGVAEKLDVCGVMDELLQPFRQVINSPGFNAVLQQVVERTSGPQRINALRRSRGLRHMQRDFQDTYLHFELLAEQGVPLLTPVNPLVMGEHKPNGMKFCDFIFLRLTKDSLPEDVTAFIRQAREARRKADMRTPAVIVMAGGQQHDPPTDDQLKIVRRLQDEGRMMVLHKGLPFGALFPELDAIILHGGLGVTSEALLAGIPVITTGILLMDQRFWANRCSSLGCGSEGVNILRLLTRAEDHSQTRIVEMCMKALDSRSELPDGGKTWRQRAREVKEMIEANRGTGDADGVVINAREVFRAGVHQAVCVRDAFNKDRDCYNGFRRQILCCARCWTGCARWFFFLQLPALFMCLVRCIYYILICRCFGPPTGRTSCNSPQGHEDKSYALESLRLGQMLPEGSRSRVDSVPIVDSDEEEDEDDSDRCWPGFGSPWRPMRADFSRTFGRGTYARLAV